MILKKRLVHYFRITLIVTAVTIVIGLSALYCSNTVLNAYLSATEYFTTPTTYNDVYIRRNLMLNLYPERLAQFSRLNKLKVFKIEINEQGLDSIGFQVEKALQKNISYKKDKNFIKAILKYEEATYEVGLKLHGNSKLNYVGQKQSLLVKVKRGKRLDGLKYFSFISPAHHRYLIPLLAQKTARKLGLHCNIQIPANLKINGKSKGVFLLDERIHKPFFKRNSLNQHVLIKLKNNYLKYGSAAINGAMNEVSYVSKKDLEYMDNDSTQYAQIILGHYRKLIQFVRDGKKDSVLSFFDLDYIAGFEAYRNLFGVVHDVSQRNLQMAFDIERMKFIPLVRSEGDLNELSIWQGSTLASYHEFKDEVKENDAYTEMFILLNKTKIFRMAKSRKLLELYLEKDSFLNGLTDVYKQYNEVFLYDAFDIHSIREKKTFFTSYVETVRNNLEKINRCIGNGLLYANLFQENDSVVIELIPDSEAPIKIESIILDLDSTEIEITNYITEKVLLADFNDQNGLKRTVFRYKFPLKISKINKCRIIARHAITGEIIKGSDLNVAIAVRN